MTRLLKVAAAVAATFVILVIVLIVGMFRGRRTNTETHGSFRIETWRYEFAGHTGHSFKIFHNHGRQSHQLAEHVAYFLDPHNPDRVLFQGCEADKDDDCALRYFDGKSEATHVVTNDRYLRSGGSTMSWSPNGRFLALPGQFQLVVLDLDTGQVFDAGAALELSLRKREIPFRVEWAPDGSAAAVTVWNILSNAAFDIETDLFVVDPAAPAIRYVASRPPARQPDPWYEWQRSGSEYTLGVIGGNTFVKPRSELPARAIF